MKKPALKKSSKEKEDISKIVSEIVEENEKEEREDEVAEIPVELDESEKETEVTEENKEGVGEPENEEQADEVTRRSSFYEKVMGEKPPERRDEVKEEKKERSINTKLFLLGAFVFVLTVLIASMAGLAILNKDMLFTQLSKKTVKPTPTAALPTPTPFAIQRDKWQFEVLNGSDTPGVAAKGSEKVKALGYKVTKVGNTDATVDAAQISFSKDANEEEKNAILKDLKPEFGDVAVGEALSDTEKTVRLILIK